MGGPKNEILMAIINGSGRELQSWKRISAEVTLALRPEKTFQREGARWRRSGPLHELLWLRWEQKEEGRRTSSARHGSGWQRGLRKRDSSSPPGSKQQEESSSFQEPRRKSKVWKAEEKKKHLDFSLGGGKWRLWSTSQQLRGRHLYRAPYGEERELGLETKDLEQGM